MRITSISLIGLAVSALTVSTWAAAAEPSLGQREYQNRCLMCHGAAGKGDGWMAQYLINRPPSLTLLKKNNRNVYPSTLVSEIIIGNKPVNVHGPREMPVWGDIYRMEKEKPGDKKSHKHLADEQAIRAKVSALTDYIAGLQE